MTTVKVHTAKCTECDKRNKDTMLRCPGCTFQICKPCRDRREKAGRALLHGGMMSPGGLGSGLGLGSGSAVRRMIAPIATGTETPPRMVLKNDDEKMVDIEDEKVEVEVKTKGKGKEKASSKKRPVKSKLKATTQDESSDDNFMPDPASPTSHKRRRTAPAITDTPTATSARPSRAAPHSAAYVAPPSSGEQSDSSAELKASVGRRLSSLNAQEVKQGWGIDVTPHLAPPSGSIEALMQAAGVNTPGNRYQEHLLSRSQPVLQNRVANVPETVRRMADRKPRMTAVQKVEERKRSAIVSAQGKEDEGAGVDVNSSKEKSHEASKPRTVREATYTESSKHRTYNISKDENEELANKIIAMARKWAVRTYDSLPAILQQQLESGLDLRLDCIDAAYTAQLEQAIGECAARKLTEFDANVGGKPAARLEPAMYESLASIQDKYGRRD
jgi:hypothetical protein